MTIQSRHLQTSLQIDLMPQNWMCPNIENILNLNCNIDETIIHTSTGSNWALPTYLSEFCSLSLSNSCNWAVAMYCCDFCSPILKVCVYIFGGIMNNYFKEQSMRNNINLILKISCLVSHFVFGWLRLVEVFRQETYVNVLMVFNVLKLWFVHKTVITVRM